MRDQGATIRYQVEHLDQHGLARWVDLDTDAQQSLRPVLEALVKHIATSIPEQR